MALGPSTKAAHVAGGLVREIWPEEALIEEIIEEEPLLGMCEKDTTWGHEVRHWPLRWGAPQGIGRTFADAKRLKSSYTSAEFQHGTREMFATLSIEGKLLRTWEYTKKKALLIDPVTTAGELAIDRMRRKFSRTIHGNGVGIIGQISASSNVATDTITLTNANDLKNFEEDVTIQWETTGATGGTVSTEEAQVESIGTEDSPTVTLADAWSTLFPGIAAGDYLVYTGTYDDDFFYGLDAYLPSHSGSPGTFLTCNRNRNPGFLAGRCMTGTNMSVYQRIKQAARKLVDAGEKPDLYLLSTRNFEKLEFEFDNKLVMTKQPAADVGKYKLGVTYQGVVVQGPRGPIKVMPSMWMPDDVERCGRLDSVVMGSIGPLVHWDSDNGPRDLRTEDGTDNRELRAVSDPGFLVKRPSAWMRVAV
jgi:hypothetical protein